MLPLIWVSLTDVEGQELHCSKGCDHKGYVRPAAPALLPEHKRAEQHEGICGEADAVIAVRLKEFREQTVANA